MNRLYSELAILNSGFWILDSEFRSQQSRDSLRRDTSAMSVIPFLLDLVGLKWDFICFRLEVLDHTGNLVQTPQHEIAVCRLLYAFIIRFIYSNRAG